MKLEILHLDLLRPGDYYLARVAVDGECAEFEFPKSVWSQFPRAEDFEAYLARSAQTLIEAYGDCRYQSVA